MNIIILWKQGQDFLKASQFKILFCLSSDEFSDLKWIVDDFFFHVKEAKPTDKQHEK